MSHLRLLAVVTLALAGLAAASAQAAAPSLARHAPPHAAAHPETAKQAACEKVWAAQKVRHGSRELFVAACVAKG